MILSSGIHHTLSLAYANAKPYPLLWDMYKIKSMRFLEGRSRALEQDLGLFFDRSVDLVGGER